MLSSLSPPRRRMFLLLAGVVALVLIGAGVAVVGRHRSSALQSYTAAGPNQSVSTSGALSSGSASGTSTPTTTSTTTSVSASTTTRPEPVLLVPGYGGSTSALSVLAAALRRHGRAAQVVSLPGEGTGDLRAQAKALSSAVDNAVGSTVGNANNSAGANGTPATVDLVGYSAGGVVARLYVRSYGGARLVRRVITLGSPQHGTELAADGAAVPGLCPTACQQLVPNSDLLTSLNRGSETPAGPTFVSLWSDVDQTVVPPDSARLKGSLGMSLQSICPASTVAHSQLPRDRLVTAVVIAELDGSVTRTFTTQDCARLSR